jgi:uncharacterized protein (TIGR04255 family)
MHKTVTYQRAPLVELIVEIKWPVQTIGVAGVPPIISGQSAIFDLWSQQFGHALRTLGYHNLERLVPHDMLVMAHQPLFRYRREDEQFPVVQMGHGIVTINAGPPTYHSWQTFRPQVERFITALVEARPADGGPSNLSQVALRYIDLFDSDHRAGASNYVFIRDDLGIEVTFPEGLIELATDQDRISPTIAVNFPVAADKNATLVFQVAAGRLGNRPSTDADTVMDMAYVVTGELPLDTVEVLSALDRAYQVIHGWFEQLTLRIRDRMQPAQ